MSRYIDADAYAAEMKTRQDACKELMDAAVAEENWDMYDRLSRAYSAFTEAKLTLDAIPTIAAVPVVRCKDCLWRHDDSSPMWLPCMERETPNDWFCADGERRTE